MRRVTKAVGEYLKEYHNTEDTAIKAGELGTLFNVRGKPLRDVINNLRQEGVPICSSWYGYWYSTNPEDISKTVRQLESRMDHMGKAVQGLNSNLEGK